MTSSSVGFDFESLKPATSTMLCKRVNKRETGIRDMLGMQGIEMQNIITMFIT